MATLEWIPISPDLKENGSFRALSHLRNADTLTPVPLGTEIEYSAFTVKQQEVDTKIAANLGLFSFLKLDTTTDVFTFLYEAAIYSSTTTDTPIGGLIYGTRYGTGYRLMLKATRLDMDANISIANIAAQATLGKASVQFELNGFGFPNNASILTKAPTPASFNVDTWAKISEYTTAVQEYLSENISGLKPKPYQILSYPVRLIDNTYEFQTYLFAYNMIKRRASLKEALRKGNNNYDEHIIRELYTTTGLMDEKTIPSLAQSESASTILNV